VYSIKRPPPHPLTSPKIPSPEMALSCYMREEAV